MPKKFVSCVRKVSKAEMKRYGYEKHNPYAVCRVSTGYYGSTRDIGLLHPLRKHMKKCAKCDRHMKKMVMKGL